MVNRNTIAKYAFILLLILKFHSLHGQNVIEAIEENSLIDQEMEKIQEDYTKSGTAQEAIPPSRLIEELNKPGNEHLLEQIKNGQTDIQNSALESDMESLKKKVDDLKDKNDNTESIESEEDKDKLKISSASEMYFSREKYFDSVKDFYGYKIFIQNLSKDEDKENKAEEKIYPARNENHIVSPGDSFVLTVWGDTEFQRNLKVTSEGTVYIENAGVISVHGLSVKELEDKLRNLLSIKYNTLKPAQGNPTTFLDIAFDKLNIVNVFVTGEVISPGAFELSPGASIISALIKARGVTAKGTLRNIHLIRNGQLVKVFDFYNYLQTGKDVNDIMLKNGDNIFVGTRINTIEIQGEVLYPLKYELKNNENLRDLIKYSGGLLTTASIDNVNIERILPMEERVNPVVYSSILSEKFTSLEGNQVAVNPIKLFDRDIVKVNTIPKILTDYVVINGAVYRKGRYNFVDNMTLNDLITKSGGMLADAYSEKIELIRTHPDQRKEYISLNFSDQRLISFKLNNFDSVNVKSKLELISKKVAVINGYIKNPGFEYISDSMRVSDLIFTRGGILDEWRKSRTYLLKAELTRYNDDGRTTRIINLNLEKVLSSDKREDLFLKDGDQLRIFDQSLVNVEQMVTISGYVKNEGEYLLSTNMTVEDLILKANGFKPGAYDFKAVIFRMLTTETSSDSLSQVFEVELTKDFLSKGELSRSNFILKNNDHVVIRKNPYYKELRKVTLTGQVKFPGVYSLVTKDETLRQLIDRAGGLTSEAFVDGTVFTRDTLVIVSDFRKAYEKDGKYGILLRDSDDVHIPLHPGTVMVEGFVYTPGLVKYRSDWGPDDYIEAAGGAIVDLEYQGTDPVIYYPGGNAKVDNGWLFSKEVREGSRIVVPKVKREQEKEWRAEVRNWIGLMTSALTLLLLYQAAQN